MKKLCIILSLITFSHAEADSILCPTNESYDGVKCSKISDIMAKIKSDCLKGRRHACEQLVHSDSKFEARFFKLAEEECKSGDADACYDLSRVITNLTYTEKFAKTASPEYLASRKQRLRTKQEEVKSYESMVRACEIASFLNPFKAFYCKQANDMKKYSNDDWIEKDCKSGESSYACRKIWSDLRDSTYPEAWLNSQDKKRLEGKTLRTTEQKKKMRWAIERACTLDREKKQRNLENCKYLEWEMEGIE